MVMNPQPEHDEDNDKPKLKMSDGEKPQLYTETLKQIFDFNDSDLHTNRANMATQAQRQALSAELQDDADGMWLILTILLGTTLLLALIMASQGIPMIYLIIGAGLLLVPFLLFAYNRQTRTRNDMDQLKVRAAQGMPQLRYRTFSRGAGYTLTIGEHDLPLTLQQAHALAEYSATPMRVYFAENSKLILSAETVQNPDIDKLKNEERQAIDEVIGEAQEVISTRRQL